MLELALFFLAMAVWAPALGPQYADVGMMSLRISEILLIGLLVFGAVALVIHKPIARRIPQHA